MDKLGVRERGQLKSLLAGETLPTDAQHSIINILRTDLPDFFSQLTSGLEKTKSGNNSEVAKYLKLNTGKTRQILKKQKLAFLTQQEQDELGSALEKPLADKGVIYQQGQEGGTAEQAPAGATGGSGGGMPNINMPSAPPISSTPRRTYTVQHAPEAPKPEIHIANKSGVVAEKPPTEFHVTDKAGNIQATYSKEPLPTAAQPKLVIANSSGAIKEPLTKNPTIHIADKSGNITKTYNIKSPSWLKNAGSNIGSKINIGINKGINKAISGINNFGNGRNVGSRSIFGRFSGGGGGRGFFGRIGRSGESRGFSVSKTVKGRGGLIFALSIIGFMVLVGGLAFTGDSSTPGGITPNPSSSPAPSYQPGAGRGIVSCPLNNTPDNPASITNGSKDASGHCSQSYVQDYGVCAQPGDANYTGKETAIDVTSLDRTVYLPLLNNTIVTWTIDLIDTNTDYIENGTTVNGGYSVRASTSSEGKTYLIRFVHMDQPSLQQGQTISSETPVGTYRTKEAHVHITIKEDDIFKPVDLYFNLCR